MRTVRPVASLHPNGMDEFKHKYFPLPARAIVLHPIRLVDKGRHGFVQSWR